MQAHGDEGSRDLVGYTPCRNPRCLTLVLDEVARHTSGFCAVCVADEVNRRVVPIEIRTLGERLQPPRSSKPKKKKKTPTPTRRAAAHARRRAMVRLKNLFPELFELFLAEERQAAGLPAYPAVLAVRPPDEVGGLETVDMALVYAALRERGVVVDGPEDHEPEEMEGLG